MTLGNAAAAHARLIVWCNECRHQIEPDPAEMPAQYGAGTPALDWRERLVCSPLSQPAGRHGGAGEMRPQPVTAAAYHVPADRPLLISRCCANRGGTYGPQRLSSAPPVHSSDP